MLAYKESDLSGSVKYFEECQIELAEESQESYLITESSNYWNIFRREDLFVEKILVSRFWVLVTICGMSKMAKDFRTLYNYLFNL